MPPKSADAHKCVLCDSALETHSRSHVVRRRQTTNVFRCNRCTTPLQSLRGAWHVDCVYKEFDAKDTEIGLQCPICDKVVVAKRQPSLLWQFMWFLWSGYPQLPFFTPRYVEFAINRVLDFVITAIGFIFMVFLHSIAPYHAAYEPGIGERVVYEDMPKQYERLREQASDSANPALAVATMVAAWIIGWNLVSALINLFLMGRGLFRWNRIQSARGISIE